MSRRRPLRRPLSIVHLAILLSWLPSIPATIAGAGDPQKPLTNEDIVRLVMTGTAEKAVLGLIEQRMVDFDLSPDVVSELGLAGVGDTLVEAMRRRQAAMPRRRLSSSLTPEGTRLGTLEIVLEGPPDREDKAGRSIIAAKALPEGARRPPGLEVGLVSDLAFAVLCTTGDHVPDHWDIRSRLEGAPRHALLLFEARSASEKKKGFEILYLDYPSAYTTSVPEGRHALQFAAVGKHVGSGAWRLLATDGATLSIASGAVSRVTLEVGSRLSGSYMSGFDLDIRWAVGAVDPPDLGSPTEKSP
jgi:hypothetical protein